MVQGILQYNPSDYLKMNLMLVALSPSQLNLLSLH
jgi:hypothetical protein